MKRLGLVLGIFLFLSASLQANIFYVNDTLGSDMWDGLAPAWDGVHGPKKMICTAVNTAAPIDEIRVADGVYPVSGNMVINLNKVLTLRSENGPEHCILDCQSMGCAIKVFHGNMAQKAIVDGFTIINGQYNSGGAILIQNNSLTEIKNCIIQNNSAQNSGGGIFAQNSVVQISGCVIENNSAPIAGGVASMNGQLEIRDCRIRNNLAFNQTAGGIYCYQNANVDIQDTQITDNWSLQGGAGLFVFSSPLSLNNTTLSGNQVYASGPGGGLYITGNAAANASSSVFSRNVSTQGGGIYCSDISQITLQNCQVTSNSSDNGGGGIYLQSPQNHLTLSQTLVNQNFSLETGGGIFSNSKWITISDSVIEDNTGSSGGGMYLNNTDTAVFTPQITGTVICHNQSNGPGSGVYARQASLTNCLFTANFSSSMNGAVQLLGESKITNCTILGNKGGGVYQANPPLLVKNSILRQNKPFQPIPSIPVISYSNVEGLIMPYGTGCIDVDPNFAIAGYWDEKSTPDWQDDEWVEGDYHLKSRAGRWNEASQNWQLDDITSTCVDAGDPADSVGLEPYPNGGRINMGFYGGTLYASKTGICTAFPAGDVNGDCITNLEDLAILCSGWLTCNRQPEQDCQ